MRLVILTAGSMSQQWSPGLFRVNVAVNVEDLERASFGDMRSSAARDRWAQEHGWPSWRQVNGLDKRLQQHMSSGTEFPEVTRLAWEAILRATEEAVRPPGPGGVPQDPGGVPQDTIVCVVWCAHGKHRSVALAEVLLAQARRHQGYSAVVGLHCEQPRWDIVERAKWDQTERQFALPLEWILEQLQVDLRDVRHRICFLHLKGNAADRIRVDWCAAADKRVPPDFFGRSRDELQGTQVRIPARRMKLA
jgi:hypothetical protein